MFYFYFIFYFKSNFDSRVSFWLLVWNLGFPSERNSAGAFDFMEAAASVAAASRVGSLPIPASRKEWRVVTEPHSVRNPGDEVVVLLELVALIWVWWGNSLFFWFLRNR